MVRNIARLSNMTKAAQMLHITQSALSQQLKDIEAKLGTDLFYRTHKKMILTPAGKILFDTAEEILGAISEAELEIARMVNGECGELKVGTKCVFCFNWLPDVLKEFHLKYPNIEFELGSSTDVVEELESKTFDVVITVGEDLPEHIQSYPLFHDQMVCVLPAQHPLTSHPFVRWQDFADNCLILPNEKNISRAYQEGLKIFGVEPKRFMAVGNPSAVIEMVAAGFGISIAPRWAFDDLLDKYPIALKQMTAKGIPLTWYASALKSNEAISYHKTFVAIVSRLGPTGERAA